jgi:hypothetical protein
MLRNADAFGMLAPRDHLELRCDIVYAFAQEHSVRYIARIVSFRFMMGEHRCQLSPRKR